MRAMAKRRENRFSNAGELAHALDEWLQAAERAGPTAGRGRSGTYKRLAAAVVIASIAAAWFLLHDDEGGPAAAQQRESPVVRSSPRNTTALLGAAGGAFDQRLNQWAPLIGEGTFGADEDGSGVIGVCIDGISGEPYVLPGGNGCVSGRIEPIAPAPGVRTLGAGAGIEFSNGRIIALLLVSATDGYDLDVCALVREGRSRLTRGLGLESFKVSSGSGQPLVFRLSWNETDAQFAGATPCRRTLRSYPQPVTRRRPAEQVPLVVERAARASKGWCSES
jgi:hypothetical protein